MAKVKVTAEYKGHPVLTGKFKEFSYNEHHLKNNLELIESCVNRHNKVFSWRMDIRFPKDHVKVKVEKSPRKFIKDFLNSYTNNLARRELDPDYVVKMEQKTSEHPHFHAQFLVNGNKVKDQKELCEMGEKLLEKQLGMREGDSAGLINYTSKPPKKKKSDTTPEEARRQEEEERKARKQNSYMIRRGSPKFEEKFDACYKRMSYLANDKKDDIIPSDQRKIFYSRYKRKKCRRKD
jgi:hypothetical protein